MLFRLKLYKIKTSFTEIKNILFFFTNTSEKYLSSFYLSYIEPYVID